MEMCIQNTRNTFKVITSFHNQIEELLKSNFPHIDPQQLRIIYHHNSTDSFSWPSDLPTQDFQTTLPIKFQREQIGELKCNTDGAQPACSINDLKLLTSQLSLVLKRLSVLESANEKFGKPTSLVGYSDALFRLERLIEKSANTRFPILFNTHIGTDILTVITTVHFLSKQRSGKLIELDCAHLEHISLEQKLIHAFKASSPGSLFLKNVDLLSLSDQAYLNSFLTHKYALQNNELLPRLLSSSQRDLKLLIKQGLFLNELYQKLNFLDITVPPLLDRTKDLPYLIKNYITENRSSEQQTMSEQCITQLSSFHWPENHQQLYLSLARLLALSGKEEISSECIEHHLPELSAQIYPEKALHAGRAKFCIITSLLNKDLTPFDKLHPSLKKALGYICHHWNQDVSLSTLANNAFVSPSHLSYLFKNTLNTSFKKILSELRVEQAKLTIDDNPNIRITDLCLEVGFGDLSHFEKIFRRHTGMSPRDYKKKIREKHQLI